MAVIKKIKLPNEDPRDIGALSSNIVYDGDAGSTTTLNNKISSIVQAIPAVPTNVSYFTNDAGYLTSSSTALNSYVPTSRTVNGKTLTANISLTNTDVGAAATSHSHGSITSAGAITTNTALANGDRIVFSDSSDSNLLKRSSITFGTNTGQYLANNGSWQNVPASYDDTALAARVTALENLEWATYYSGRTNPVSSLGQDGDIYLQY